MTIDPKTITHHTSEALAFITSGTGLLSYAGQSLYPSTALATVDYLLGKISYIGMRKLLKDNFDDKLSENQQRNISWATGLLVATGALPLMMMATKDESMGIEKSVAVVATATTVGVVFRYAADKVFKYITKDS